MRNKYKALAGNTIIFAIGSFGSKLISFFLVPLYTNILTTAEYGISDLVTTCANLIVPIFSLTIQDAVLRFGLSKAYGRESVIKNAWVVFLLGALASLSIIPALQLYEPLKEWRYYLYAISLVTMASNIMFAYARAKEKSRLYALGGVINTVVLALANILFLLVFRMGVQGYLLANILGRAAAVLFLFFFTKAYEDIKGEKTDKLLMREMIAYAAPLIINSISWWILNSSDRIMVKYYCSASSLGLYTAASKVPALLSIVVTIFSQAWTVSAIKDYDSEKDKTFYANIFRIFCFVMFVGGAIVILITKAFMKIYVGDSFFETWNLVPLLVVGAVYYAFSSFFGAIYGALKKNIRVGLTTLVAAIINIGINFWLLPKIGVLAAAVSTAMGYFVIGVYQMLDSQRLFRFQINYIKYGINSVILIAQAVLVSLNIHIYLVSAAALGTMLIVNSKDIAVLARWCRGLFRRLLHKNKEGK